MNKQELIAHVADESKSTKAVAGAAIDALIGAIEGSLKKGEEVRLTGFGTFGVKHSAARNGRNPATGAAIKIAASSRPVFRAGAELKAAAKKAPAKKAAAPTAKKK